MAGQNQAVRAPAGPMNDTRQEGKLDSIKSKDALAPVAAVPRTSRLNFETKRCGAPRRKVRR